MKKFQFFLFAFILIFPASSHSSSAASVKGPKVLMFTEIDPYYLRDTISHWGEDVGINGFMLTLVANWWTPREELFGNLAILKEVNQKGALYGVDRNFIKVALGYKDLPAWTDDRGWEQVIRNFKNIAELIKESGTRGIALDTEPYTIPFFDAPANPPTSTYLIFLKAKIYQRGRQIMEAVEGVYPGIEVVTFPEGALFWFNPDQGPNPKGAELWIDFYNGLAAGRKKGRLILAAEKTYSETTAASVAGTYDLLDRTMREQAEDKAFWREKCSIAIGMWPLGKTYTDKSARYSVEDFREQFARAAALSPEYVWIYDHGTAWLRLTNEEVLKYNVNNHSIWEKDIQVLPTDPLIQDYYRVVKTRGQSE